MLEAFVVFSSTAISFFPHCMWPGTQWCQL